MFFKTAPRHIREISTMIQDPESQTLTLPDGRALGFAEYGDSNGSPILFFHGLPGSRLEVKGIAKLAARQSIRLIGLDRPGFGLSTFQPGRRITDWPKDIEALATHLNLKQFAVMGYSAGGAYALACAYSLPQSMLSSVVLLASVIPWASGKQGVPGPSYLLHLGATYAPRPTKVMTGLISGALRELAYTQPGAWLLDKWVEKIDQEAVKKTSIASSFHDETLSTQQRREHILKLGFEPFAQGGAAFVQEAQLLFGLPWGFDLEDVKYDKVKLWHGVEDQNIPVEQIRWMAERLPHCELHVVKGNHHSVTSYFGEIFETVVQKNALIREKELGRPES